MDRDYRSFKDFQYDKVLEICKENEFLLGITNPNFEFYLLLHLDDSLSMDKEEIRTNPRKTSNKKLIEYTLNEKMKEYGCTYKKNNYDANLFIDKFTDFKKNINNYVDDNRLLKNEIGSSIHHIMNRLLEY
ncbi:MULTISPECIES: RloB domain-containing protein [Bacillaceae]|uniref:RloB domain-containing protein n=1 Tax=Bacillaceae TaxID=186817 RepID=UPI002965326B|nr:RloB domain-containing protein [Bacillus infantis]MDW2879560.1 RloB domain-containing protein [Bacillus infantis]